MRRPPFMPLAEAVRRFVEPSMHLHFASTPSRANGAIRAVARHFLDRRPNFTVSTSGFHSSAHLVGLLRLARRYIACFFGDNYPEPRPNRLYAALEEEGAQIESWSLLAYVAALRAGALGHPYALVRPPAGTTLEAELVASGRAIEIADPRDPCSQLRLLLPIRPDVTFVHAAAADEDGVVLASAPYSEGRWSALGASRGAIVTVETIVPRSVTRRSAHAVMIPPHRILAIAIEPFGAHPQPLYCPPELGSVGYRDDYVHYQAWRRIAEDVSSFREFVDGVLRAEDGDAAYRSFVGGDRLEALRRPPATQAAAPALLHHDARSEQAASEARMVLLAARHIVDRVRARGYRVILAGIGHAFFAARLARRWLAEVGFEVPVMVETGLYDVDCDDGADSFLLSHANIERATRHSDVEDVLGALTCGSDNACLAVIGAAQVDARGRLNSTRLAGGRLLVGSGGASDIASAATEVVVLVPCDPKRIVADVDYVTSPGERVLGIATDRCVLVREDHRSSWRVTALDAPTNDDVRRALDTVISRCGFPLDVPSEVAFGPPISIEEYRALSAIDPERRYPISYPQSET